jgi:hypothetical protein
MHPSLENILRGFKYDHLKPGDVQDTSKLFASLANYLVKDLPSSPEMVAGLRKLMEAKDCFVRAAVFAVEDSIEKAKASEPSNTGEKDGS